MELRHLRYFVAVAEEQHFTRAAERLGMQQPPLSLQIRALETELGFDLFLRHPKGASLTAGGAVFFEEAQAILAGIDAAAARAASAASGATGQLRIGLTSSAAAHGLIPAVMRRYRAAWPGVQIDFSEKNAAELGEALAGRRLHAAFLRLPVHDIAEVRYEALLMEPMLLALPTGHRAIVRDGEGALIPVPLAVFDGETVILVRRRGAPGMYANLMAACAAAGAVPGRVIEVERMLTNISLVAAGAGVSVVPASMQGFHAGSVVYCPMADVGADDLAAPLTLGVRRDETSPALRHFVDTVHAVLEDWT